MSAATHGHPVIETITDAQALLAGLAERPLWSLTAPEVESVLVLISSVRSQVESLELRCLAVAEQVGAGASAGHVTRAWWRTTTRHSRRTSHRLHRLALALDSDFQPTQSALGRGEIRLEQAQAIVTALDDLSAEENIDAAMVHQAEHHLIDLAQHHDADELRILGRRILDVIDPVVSERREQRLLEEEEARAADKVRFTISDDGDGSCRGRFTLPLLHGQMLRKAVLALANPARPENPGFDVPSPQRMGRAFQEYVERFPTDQLPTHGGVAATVVITIPLSNLAASTGSAHLDTGGVISARETLRIACQAGLVPAILDGNGVALHLGRNRRLHTAPQRLALALRDQGCSAHGCDTPPALCHTHHDQPWSQGGRTSTDNGRLLCPKHHRLAHNPSYTAHRTAANKIVFHHRT